MRHQFCFPIHQARRLLLMPWRRTCRCGLGAWPCPALAILQRQEAWKLGNTRPRWAGPTRQLPVAPLLTRGQAARTRQGDRW